jgi:hypothetical protein
MTCCFLLRLLLTLYIYSLLGYMIGLFLLNENIKILCFLVHLIFRRLNCCGLGLAILMNLCLLISCRILKICFLDGILKNLFLLNIGFGKMHLLVFGANLFWRFLLFLCFFYIFYIYYYISFVIFFIIILIIFYYAFVVFLFL